MSQHHHHQQQQGVFLYPSAGSKDDLNNVNINISSHQEQSEVSELPKNRREGTDHFVEILYTGTLTQRPGERNVIRTGGRKNKNETLALTLARFVKDKHLNGHKYQRDVELLRGIQMSCNNAEFVLVLRTDGRIVSLSDEVEQHFGKSIRSLYTQCVNIYECLDQTDGNKLRLILNTPVDSTRQEHRLVCTFRLPKGKRPSRVHEDIKTITMAGHFYSCHDSSTSSSRERLFIARCEALISTTSHRSNSSQAATMINNNNNNNNSGNSTMKITLNEDMSISMVSSNVKDTLGYSRNEMVGNWFGRYLASDDVDKLQAIRQKYFEQEQQLPTSICDMFDMYTSNGNGRLTFLCQIRPIRERRSKSIKFAIVAQLIDPSLRSEYIRYVQSESVTEPKLTKAKQYHHQYRKRAKIQSWPIARPSPTWLNSYSTTSAATTVPINSNTLHSIDHSQMLLHRSTSMMNLGSTYSTSTTTNLHYQQQIGNSGQANLSMILPPNINSTPD